MQWVTGTSEGLSRTAGVLQAKSNWMLNTPLARRRAPCHDNEFILFLSLVKFTLALIMSS
jgi:hypothetical protein